VAPIVGDSFSTEDARDRLGEAEEVMRLADVKPGMWVADVGAGEGGLAVVVDSDRPTNRHGIPPAQLKCEFAAIGLQPVTAKVLTGGEGYLMAFRVAAERPAPDKIKPCRG
jgi:hypothetical protein